eukprot:3912398-Amphidinium_carterae.1
MVLYGNAPEAAIVAPEVASPVNPEKLFFLEYLCPPKQSKGDCSWAMQHHDWQLATALRDACDSQQKFREQAHLTP